MRDAHIDQIGLIEELKRKHAEKLRVQLKARLLQSVGENGCARAEADRFEALLVTGLSSARIVPKKFFGLLKSQTITEADFISCLSVSREKAMNLLGSKLLDPISKKFNQPDRLAITRKKGVEFDLVEAVRKLAAEMAGAA